MNEYKNSNYDFILESPSGVYVHTEMSAENGAGDVLTSVNEGGCGTRTQWHQYMKSRKTDGTSTPNLI